MLDHEDEAVPVILEEDTVPAVSAQFIEDQCNAMKVVELKNELGLRNLTKNDRNQELLARIPVAVRSNASLVK